MSRLQLFGPPTLELPAQSKPLPAGRPYQLLAYLACRGSWVGRDAAAALLWPERDTSTARANLRFVLVQIRRLGLFDDLVARPDALQWTVESDVQRFERAVAARRWADALAEYGGPFLDGFDLGAPPPFAEWLQFERARLRALWRDALAARLAELGDDHIACLALAATALQADPLDETALVFQLRAFAALGRTDETRRAYRDYAQRLAADLGIEPSAAVRDVVRRIEAPPTDAAPLPRVQAAAPGALVGRRTELGRIGQLLGSEECRLLTIVGPGGAGKSVLARAALREQSPRFAAGAVWVALDDLQSIDQVAPRCASMLDLPLSSPTSPQHQLIERLRDSAALLVLDNAEHLPGLGDWLAALLAECTRVKVLVTSRARLDVPGEWLLALEGLPVPDADETETDALRAFDAVRLFETRAARLLPDLDFRAHAADVTALVRAVAGLPLAIELAAAWVRVLPVAEIKRELERSLDLLGQSDPGGGRSRSVRDSFEHSWRLLVPAEQRALMSLAAFQGSFSRESALAVGGVVLPLLAALVDKSLVRAADDGRFSFHPLIQQFALEKLALQPDEAQAARRRHAEHFLALLARYNDFHAIDQRAALAAIGAEIENMLAAWQWAVAQRRVDLLQNSASALESYLDARGQPQLGLDQLGRAAAIIDDALPAHQLARCHVQLACAAFCYRLADFAQGERAARAALQAAHRIKYRFGVKSSTNTLGLMLWRLGRTKEAAFCLRDVLRRAQADADLAAIPLYELNLGRLERELGNDAESERLLDHALAESRRQGNLAGLQMGLNELGHHYLELGRARAVLPLATEGLALCEDSGFRRAVPYFHRLLADACFELNDMQASASHARSALEATLAAGDRSLEPACRVRLASIALRAGDAAGAMAELKLAASLAKAAGSPRIQVEVIVTYAACVAAGRRGYARNLLRLCLQHPAATPRQRERVNAELAQGPAAARASEGDADPPTVADLDQALDLLLAEPA